MKRKPIVITKSTVKKKINTRSKLITHSAAEQETIDKNNHEHFSSANTCGLLRAHLITTYVKDN